MISYTAFLLLLAMPIERSKGRQQIGHNRCLRPMNLRIEYIQAMKDRIRRNGEEYLGDLSPCLERFVSQFASFFVPQERRLVLRKTE